MLGSFLLIPLISLSKGVKMILVPIAGAIFLWISGYLMTAHFMSTSGVHGGDLEKIITPPQWLYYLCGAPVSKKYPKGAMRVVAFRTQIGGIFLGLYVIWYLITRPPTVMNAMGFLFFMVIPFLISAYVSKRYTSGNQPGIRKGRK